MKKLITFTSLLFVTGKEVNTRAGVIVTWASVGPSDVADVFMVTIHEALMEHEEVTRASFPGRCVSLCNKLLIVNKNSINSMSVTCQHMWNQSQIIAGHI